MAERREDSEYGGFNDYTYDPYADQNRTNTIKGFYTKYLGREADDAGLRNFVGGGLDLGAVENAIKGSDEAKQWLARSAQPAQSSSPTYTAQAPTNPDQFIGYDFGAHQGQTFNTGNPAEGAKYAVANVLNGMDPNDPNWATRAAQQLNQQFGQNIFRADGGERLSYGDEFVDSTKQSGRFFWGSNGPGGSGGGGGVGAGGGTASAASAASGSGADNGLLQELLGRLTAQDAERKARADSLYQQLQGRAQQSLAIDRNDPIIRAQADAFSANQERATRNYLGDLAERSGPLANLQGQQRIAAERLGQATGGFEAELLGRELSARRSEIADALNSMRGILSGDQQAELQRELAALDAAIRDKQLNQNSSQFGSDLAYRYANLAQQGDQFSRNLGQQESQFGRQLGFNYANLDNDLLRVLLSGIGG